uniref:Uncharacterized protein n=1 Tax=Cucumis melo TaxID=3656 RepID=A0A9I9E7P2_CUCME
MGLNLGPLFLTNDKNRYCSMRIVGTGNIRFNENDFRFHKPLKISKVTQMEISNNTLQEIETLPTHKPTSNNVER